MSNVVNQQQNLQKTKLTMCLVIQLPAEEHSEMTGLLLPTNLLTYLTPTNTIGNDNNNDISTHNLSTT